METQPQVDSTLSIGLDTAHPVTCRAAWELARAWRDVGGRRARLGGPGDGPHVWLGLGSLVRPSAVVRFEVPFAEDAAARADQLALTIAAWDSLGGPETWRVLSAPLSNGPRVGQPRSDRPWVLAMGGERYPRPAAGEQLHVIGGAPGQGDVWWPAWSRLAAPLLGRAECVLGRANALAYDAVRAGVVVRTDGGELDQLHLDGALAGLVPPSLTTDPDLWRHVAETARAVHTTRRAPAPLMTPSWIARGRDRIRAHLASPPSPWERMRRRRDKFFRDPKRFFADSKHASLRAFGGLAFRVDGD